MLLNMLLQLAANRHSGDEEILAASKVRKHERSERIAPLLLGEEPRCRPNAPGKPVGPHSCPSTDVPLRYRTFGSAFEGSSYFHLPNVTPPDIIEKAIVALADNRVDCPCGDTDGGIALKHICYQ